MITDTFRGDNATLIGSIKALLNLDSAGALKPHGIGGHARTLLASAAVRLAGGAVPASEPAPSTSEILDEAIVHMRAINAVFDRVLASAPVVVPVTQDMKCEIPPDGWVCSRMRGHGGPCAASPSPFAAASAHAAGLCPFCGSNDYEVRANGSKQCMECSCVTAPLEPIAVHAIGKAIETALESMPAPIAYDDAIALQTITEALQGDFVELRPGTVVLLQTSAPVTYACLMRIYRAGVQRGRAS